MNTLEKLINWCKLVWFKITIAFKNPSMKYIFEQIENCLKNQILNTIPNLKTILTTYEQNNNPYQVKYEVEMENHNGFVIIIDFNTVNSVKYSIENVYIPDIDLHQAVINTFATRLNQNKDYINRIIIGYFTIHPK